MSNNAGLNLEELLMLGLALLPACPEQRFSNPQLETKKSLQYQFEATHKRQQEKPFNTNSNHRPKPHNSKTSALVQRNSRKK